jgi:hypothetical protein
MSEDQKPVSAGGMFWVVTTVAIFAGMLWVAHEKTERMVDNFAGISVRDRSPSSWPDYIERQLAGLSARITSAEQSAPPRGRETKAEERERWEDDKEHLYHHVAELEAKLKEKTDELETVINSIQPETYAAGESAFIDNLAKEEAGL